MQRRKQTKTKRVLPRQQPKIKNSARQRTRAAKSRVQNRPSAGVALQRAPEIVVNSALEITVTHTEKIRSVSSSILNTNHSLIINPRRSGTFPWLSKIAEAFDMYRILKMSVIYRPSCPTTTRGELIMAFDYDPTDDNVNASSSDLAAMRGAVSGPLYTPSVLQFELGAIPQSTHKFFCSFGGNPDRLNDEATLWFNASSDAALVAGSLYLSYTIQLIDPEPVTASYGQTAGIRSLDLTTVTENNLLGTVQQVVANTPVPELLQALNGNVTPLIADVSARARTAYLSAVQKTHDDLDRVTDNTNMREYISHGFVTTDHGFVPFDDDGLYVHVIAPDACSDLLLNAPVYGTFVPAANAAPRLQFQCSPNITVVSSICQFTGTFATGVPVITFGCIWFVLKYTAGQYGWYRFGITNGGWTTASVQNWQMMCVPDVQQWTPKYA